MLVWHKATTVRIHHFFLVEKAYAVRSIELASVRTEGPAMLKCLEALQRLLGAEYLKAGESLAWL